MSRRSRTDRTAPREPRSAPRWKRRAVSALLLLVALWPLVHRGLVARYRIHPWKFGGFAMYTTHRRSLAIAVDAESGAPVDEQTLSERGRAALAAFREERHSYGRLSVPDRAAEAVLLDRPDLDHLKLVVQLLWLDPETGRIASDHESYVYVRNPAGAR